MRVRRFARLEHESSFGVMPATGPCRPQRWKTKRLHVWRDFGRGGCDVRVRKSQRRVSGCDRGCDACVNFGEETREHRLDYVAHVPRESSCLSALPLRSAAEINHSRTERIVRESSGQGATDFEPSIRRHNTPRAIIGNHR